MEKITKKSVAFLRANKVWPTRLVLGKSNINELKLAVSKRDNLPENTTPEKADLFPHIGSYYITISKADNYIRCLA